MQSNNKPLYKFLTAFIKVWVFLVLIINIIAIIGFFIEASSFWEGWQKIVDTYSPFNIINYIMELMLLSPAIGAYLWHEKLKTR